MNEHPDHLLSPEERALADRLRRLGPHGSPAPALDAKILAAARAAAPARTARPGRRLLRIGLPAGLITAAGTAAAFVLAVGLVWQLRPAERPAVQPPSSVASDDGFVMAEVIVTGKEASPAPASTAAAAAPARSARAPVSVPPLPAAQDTRQPMADATTASAIEAVAASAPAPVDTASASAEPEAAAMTAAGTADPAQDAATPARPIPAAPRRASYTSAALATAERPAPRADNPPAPATATAPPPALESVDADTALPPAEWLQRVRDRRDTGDADGARESLRRFREAYPRAGIPRDLRRLLR